jgi:hypothetical protein
MGPVSPINLWEWERGEISYPNHGRSVAIPHVSFLYRSSTLLLFFSCYSLFLLFLSLKLRTLSYDASRHDFLNYLRKYSAKLFRISNETRRSHGRLINLKKLPTWTFFMPFSERITNSKILIETGALSTVSYPTSD